MPLQTRSLRLRCSGKRCCGGRICRNFAARFSTKRSRWHVPKAQNSPTTSRRALMATLFTFSGELGTSMYFDRLAGRPARGRSADRRHRRRRRAPQHRDPAQQGAADAFARDQRRGGEMSRAAGAELSTRSMGPAALEDAAFGKSRRSCRAAAQCAVLRFLSGGAVAVTAAAGAGGLTGPGPMRRTGAGRKRHHEYR